MSLTHADFASARDTILRSKADADVAEALVALERMISRSRLDALLAAWGQGRKGEGAARADGLTETLTGVLRRLYASSVVAHADVADLSRHVCALRKLLPASVEIVTVKNVGYRLEAGETVVYRLLGGPDLTQRVADFTPKETQILRMFAERGALHRDQVKALVRHLSNIRVKLKPYAVQIATAGEGLYTVTRDARSALKKLLAGELKPHAFEPKRGYLALVAA